MVKFYTDTHWILLKPEICVLKQFCLCWNILLNPDQENLLFSYLTWYQRIVFDLIECRIFNITVVKRKTTF